MASLGATRSRPFQVNGAIAKRPQISELLLDALHHVWSSDLLTYPAELLASVSSLLFP